MMYRNSRLPRARRASLNWQGSGLEIHDRVTDFGVRISGPPPFSAQLADSWSSARVACTGRLLGQPARASTGYSITWSARPSTDCGIVRPSALAVLRLITNSNLVGCSTGRSAGLAPLRILSTYVAACRQFSTTLGPYCT